VALIRPAEFDDAARLGRVHVETWRATYRGLLPDDYLDGLSDIRQAAFWSRALDDADRAAGATVAEDEDAGVVGFCDCGPERGGATGGEILAIYILPEWQRQELGRRLIAASAAHLIANGFESLAVWALEDNPARAFYTALGGAPAEKRRLSIGGIEVIEQCYRWPSMGAELRTD
jgi:ribosomal protein S18 acetylase RimI-like enzyme